METLKIRPIARTDCTAILKMIKELGSAKHSEDDISIKVVDLERNGFDVSHEAPLFQGIIVKITEPDIKTPQTAGVALYHLKYSTWEGPVMHLNTFVVASKYQRQGVGTKMLKHLAKIAQEKKYTRISFEVSKLNESGMSFFLKHGAYNLTKDEEWLNYDLGPEAVKNIRKDVKKVENVKVRQTVPQDCVRIKEMIQELAEFEKMPDAPKLTAKELQRDGFFKLHPDYYSFVAEDSSEDKEIVGYSMYFLTYDPYKGKRIHLEDLYVTPKHRGKGVGQMLFEALAKAVEDGGYYGFTLEVLAWNKKAVEFYDKFGGINTTAGEKQMQSFRFKQKEIQRLALSS